MTTNETVDTEHTEVLEDNEVTVREIDFNEFTTYGNNDYDILGEDNEIIYLNDIIWVKYIYIYIYGK